MLSEVCRSEGRLEQLVELRNKLAEAIDECESMRDLASLSRQYRETIREIEEIEGDGGDDEISKILQERDADGVADSVR